MLTSRKNESGINLKRIAPNVKRIGIELGWKPRGVFNILANLLDVEAGIICIGENKKYEGVVYYGNPIYLSKSIVYHQNNVSDSRSSRKKYIMITLDEVPQKISCLAITLNIHSAFEKYQHFGVVKNCYIRVVDYETRKELVRYNITGDFNSKTAIFVADLYRNNDYWKLSLVEQGVQAKSIDEMVKMICK